MFIEEVHNHCIPLGEKIERWIPEDETYYDCKDAAKMWLSTYSDVMMKVVVEFSYDGINRGSQQMVRSTSLWIANKIDLPMRYVRFHVVNESGSDNLDLKLVAKLIGLNHHSKSVAIAPVPPPLMNVAKTESIGEVRAMGREIALVDHKDVVEEVKKETRGKSPFERFRKKENAVKSVPVKDPRIPEFLPAGCILYGTGNGFKILPKGEEGMMLFVKDGVPCWSLPYPPRDLSDNSRKLLRDSSWIINDE